MEQIVKRTLLYDFYGELLTDRQREIYESVVLEDYSLSEVAEDQGVSRQSVYDMIRRCDSLLGNYEARLHLVEKFLRIRDQAARVRELCEACGLTEAVSLCNEMIGEL